MKLIGTSRFLTSVALLALPFLLVAGTAGAQVIHEDSTATQILGLQVGQETYDVTFVYGTAADIYPGDAFDFFSHADALLAVEAIRDAFNALWSCTDPSCCDSPGGGTEIRSVGPQEEADFFVAYDRAGNQMNIDFGSLFIDTQACTRFIWEAIGPDVVASDATVTWAVFSDPVPVEFNTWGRIKSLFE